VTHVVPPSATTGSAPRRSVSFLVTAILWLGVAGCRDAPSASDAAGPLPPALAAAPDQRLRLTYMCANRYRVRNYNPEPFAPSFDVYNTPDRGWAYVPARPTGADYAEAFFVTERRGTVRLFVDGVLQDTKANGGTNCTSASLHAEIDPGVSTPLAGGQTSVAVGSTVTITAVPAPGYDGLRAFVDGRPVTLPYALLATTHHSVRISANRVVDGSAPTIALAALVRRALDDADPGPALRSLDTLAGSLDAAASPSTLAYWWASALYRAVRMPEDLDRVIALDATADAPATAARAHPVRAAAAVGAPRPERFAVHLINGIMTSRLSARLAAERLRPFLAQAGFDTTGAELLLQSSYNPTSADSVSRHHVCVRHAYELAPLLGRHSIDSLIVTCLDRPPLSEGAQFRADVAEAVADAWLVLRFQTNAVDRGVQITAGKINQYRGDGRHVVSVAHSQGNLKLQQAVFPQAGLIRSPDHGSCFTALSLAAPTSLNWPYPADRLRAVMLVGDILDRWVPLPKFPAITTAQSTRLRADNRDGGRAIHDLLGSYLGDPELRPLTVQHLRDLRGRCTATGVVVSPGAASVAVGATAQFAAAVVNEAGATLPERWVRWELSDSALATVDSTGRVTGLQAGAVTVTARAMLAPDIPSVVARQATVTITAGPGGGGTDPTSPYGWWEGPSVLLYPRDCAIRLHIYRPSFGDRDIVDEYIDCERDGTFGLWYQLIRFNWSFFPPCTVDAYWPDRRFNFNFDAQVCVNLVDGGTALAGKHWYGNVAGGWPQSAFPNPFERAWPIRLTRIPPP
jgi:hypothetical protein